MASKSFSLTVTLTVLFLLAISVTIIAIQPPRKLQGGQVFNILPSEKGTLAETVDNSMVLIPSGVFVMGSQEGRLDEQPQHLVYLNAYWIDRYEVTNAQYRRFVLANHIRPPRYWSGEDYPAGQDLFPVVGVSWSQAQAYCSWRSKRLPTEAEWEKACRGGLEIAKASNSMPARQYPWGDGWDPANANDGFKQAANWPIRLDDAWDLLSLAQLLDDFPHLVPVGSFSADSSPYGIFDLAGNASEWVFDWYNWEGYTKMPGENPLGLGPPWNHVVRGGAWMDRRGQEDLVSNLCRCSARSSSHSFDDPRIGFRCAASVAVRR